jgi:TolB-like protein/lipoprotein NlpI
MRKFVEQLRERNIWRAALAYPAAAFVFLEVVDFFVDNYRLDERFLSIAVIVFVGALPIVLVWNWCHGQRGPQKIGKAQAWSYVVLSAITLAAAGWYWAVTPARVVTGLDRPDLSRNVSIAVLPFTTSESDTEIDYLCDGIAESLIHMLSAAQDLKVISRVSAFRLRDRLDEPMEVGRILGVRNVLSGQLERHDDDLIAHVTLVDTRDGRELWGDSIMQPMTEILELEDRIATEIAAALRLRLPARASYAGRTQRVDSAAYRHYQQGRFLAHGSTGDEIELGLEHLREAIKLDPSFAPAYSAIADATIVKAFFSTSPISEIVGEAQTAAHSAIALDPELPEAYSALASIRLFLEYDLTGSEEAFHKAISLGSTSSTTYYRYANLLTALGRFDEAIRMAEEAIARDPIATGALHALGFAKLLQGDFEGAAVAFGNAVEVRPDWKWGYVKKSLAHALMGEQTEALALAAQAEEMTAGWGSAFLQGWLAWIYSVSGQEERLNQVVERINKAIEENRIEDPFGVAITYLAIGEHSMALDWIEKTVDEHSPNAIFWKVGTADHMRLDTSVIREDPRFVALLEKINLE